MEIYRNGVKAGLLTESAHRHYVFTYEDNYFSDSTMPAISLTLPKNQKEYRSEYLFPDRQFIPFNHFSAQDDFLNIIISLHFLQGVLCQK